MKRRGFLGMLSSLPFIPKALVAEPLDPAFTEREYLRQLKRLAKAQKERWSRNGFTSDANWDRLFASMGKA